MRNPGSLRLISSFLILVVLVLACNVAFSQTLNAPQEKTSTSKWDVGLNLGMTQFYGDVSSHNFFQKLSKESRIGVQVYAKKMFNPVIGAGVSLFSTGLESIKDRNKGQVVNYNLGGNYDDLTVFAYANLNNLFGGYKDNRRFSFYGTLGFGVSTWNTALTNNLTGGVIHSGTTAGSRHFVNKAFCVPLGAGLDYRIDNHWAVHAGGTFTTVLSDDLDLWHDGANYDQLFYAHVGVTYFIKPGNRKNFSRKKKNRRNQQFNKSPIPIFDYMVNPGPGPTPLAPQKKKIDVLNIPEKKTPTEEKKTKVNLQFRVQIAASHKPLDPSLLRAKYKLNYTVRVVHQDGYYFYSVGDFSTYQEALAACRKILLLGVRGAFVTAYVNGQRVHLTNKMMHKGFNYQEVTPDFY